MGTAIIDQISDGGIGRTAFLRDGSFKNPGMAIRESSLASAAQDQFPAAFRIEKIHHRNQSIMTPWFD